MHNYRKAATKISTVLTNIEKWTLRESLPEKIQDEESDKNQQITAFVGYRSPRRKAELSLGLLNITDQNYNLNPLNLYDELPRSRTLALSLRLNF